MLRSPAVLPVLIHIWTTMSVGDVTPAAAFVVLGIAFTPVIGVAIIARLRFQPKCRRPPLSPHGVA
jgi:hypothetical protein